eukprot:TRINITY_DN1163_c0_g1_i1.p1 TRINITY_DN1163_c0_g1~~TRINITY_DN1163_c0_g1_i1.p1  ORF type:complete len:376 (-),score=51.91 TRINITY_DN1163_c0_g1_i1:37-1014(-)
MEPFEALYAVVFRLSCRMLCCDEVANDRDLVKKVTKLFWDLQKGGHALPILAPWYPSTAKRLQKKAGAEIYGLLVPIIENRKNSSEPVNDSLQFLLDEGKSTPEIVQFILSALFAAIINTGIASAWLTLHISTNADWKRAIEKEQKEIFAKYKLPTDPLKLNNIPLAAVEEMTVLDHCLKEVIRLTISGAVMRRVMRPTEIYGHTIQSGEFVVNSIGTTHLAEGLYQNVGKFDPARFDETKEKGLTGYDIKKEGKAAGYPFLGWGVGKHPCLGMRFAKLEIKLITTMLIASYNFELVSPSLPGPDHNNIDTTKPNVPVYVRFSPK